MSRNKQYKRVQQTKVSQSFEPLNYSYREDKSDGKARIYELCQEDKNRIGELINKLVHERRLRDELKTSFENELNKWAKERKKFIQENAELNQEVSILKNKLERSLDLLKTYQETVGKQTSVFSYSPTPTVSPERPRTPVLKEVATSPQAKSGSSFYDCQKTVSTQTTHDKEIQTAVTELKPEEQSMRQGPVTEVKHLKQDLANLSASLKNLHNSMSPVATGKNYGFKSPELLSPIIPSRDTRSKKDQLDTSLHNPLLLDSLTVLKQEDKSPSVHMLSPSTLGTPKPFEFSTMKSPQYNLKLPQTPIQEEASCTSEENPIFFNDALFTLIEDMEMSDVHNSRSIQKFYTNYWNKTPKP